MKEICILLLFTLGLVLSCGSGPQPADTAATPGNGSQSQVKAAEPAAPTAERPAETQPVVSQPVESQAGMAEEKNFDPESISKEVFDAAMADIKELIDNLNRIIRARNYNAWAGYLANSYLAAISSRDFLEERTEELFRRDQSVAANLGRDPKMVEKRILRTPTDYFTHVVVPSRSNDRADDISFISETRVRAYTVDTRGSRLVLYDLELIDGKWKIVN